MKNVLKDLWQDKPLLITVVIGLAVVVYLLYKSNSASVIAPGSAAGQVASGTLKKHRSQHDRTGSPPIPTPGPSGPAIVG